MTEPPKQFFFAFIELLLAESEEELQVLVDAVKEGSRKYGLDNDNEDNGNMKKY